jgi:uncharacterized membrane protein HdeD (DUF308 family)
MKKDVLAEGIGYTIILIGIISSLIAGNIFKTVDAITYSTKYNWGLAIGSSISSIILGMIFIFIGEIIYNQVQIIKRIERLSDKE